MVKDENLVLNYKKDEKIKHQYITCNAYFRNSNIRITIDIVTITKPANTNKYDAATITEENKVDKHIDILINSRISAGKSTIPKINFWNWRVQNGKDHQRFKYYLNGAEIYVNNGNMLVKRKIILKQQYLDCGKENYIINWECINRLWTAQILDIVHDNMYDPITLYKLFKN